MATQTTTSVEKSTPASDGATKLAWVPYRAPAAGDRAGEREGSGLVERRAHAERDQPSSFSRMPTSSLPKGARLRPLTSAKVATTTNSTT